MTDARVDYLIKRQNQMETIKMPWLNVWQQLSDYILPKRSDFTGTSINTTQGRVKSEKIFDGTPVWANEQLASGLHGALTDPTKRWFDLTLDDPKIAKATDVKKWLGEVSDLIYGVFNSPSTFFSQQIHELYLDIGAFGTAAMAIDEDFKTVCRFQTYHLNEVYCMESARGIIDSVNRKFSYTLRQAVQRYGNALPPKLLTAYNEGKDMDKEFEFLHCILPREEMKVGKVGATNMPYASYTIMPSEKFMVNESGFMEMPIKIPRWSKITGETFGRGPGMTCLPDIKMLNEMMKMIIKAAQKVVDPPLMVPDDGFLLPIVTYPGGLNFYSNTGGGTNPDLIKALDTKGKINIGFDLLEQRQNHVLKCFYVDWLQLREGPEMTATEVLQRTEERMRLMSPMVGRLQSELLGPMIERVFSILLRQRRIPQPPAALRGQEVKIRYISPIARAQKMSQVMAVERLLQAATPLMTLKPEMIDRFDGDGIVDWLTDLFDAPVQILTNNEKVKQIRAAREQAAQDEVDKTDMERTAQGMRNVAPLLKVMQGGQGV